MKYKRGQMVAYYKVTGKSEPCAAKVEIGSILVDRPQGKRGEWTFFNFETNEESWVVGKRLGFAFVDDDLKPVPTEALQSKLDALKAAS